MQIGDLKVGAIVAVNARGDIYDWKDGKKVAGLLNADRKTFADTEEAVYKSYEVIKNKFTGATENTTIGAVITNAAFPKSSLCKIAGMAHDAMRGRSVLFIPLPTETASTRCLWAM